MIPKLKEFAKKISLMGNCSSMDIQKVVILICTRGTNHNLGRLVHQLQAFVSTTQFQIRIGIVWNNSIPIPNELAGLTGVTIVTGQDPGYASVRNEALKLRYNDESIYFVDDDELLSISSDDDPHSTSSGIENGRFLLSHMEMAFDFPKSIFVGKVVPISLSGVPYPDYRNSLSVRPHGQIINFASAGNLFIPQSIFELTTVEFDTFFDGGGEDSALSMKLRRNGIVTRWNSESVLYEMSAEERFSIKWQIQRVNKNYALNWIARKKYDRTVELIIASTRLLIIILFHLIKIRNRRPAQFISLEVKCFLYLLTGLKIFIREFVK